MHKLDNLDIGYTYDDLLIRPIKSEVHSRQDVNLSTELFDGVILKTPIIAAPMNTVAEHKMLIKMFQLGGLGILHRFKGTEDMDYQMSIVGNSVPKEYCAFAVGVNDRDKFILTHLYSRAGIVCIDLNVGHHSRVEDMIGYISEEFPNLKIIAGNVSTYKGAYDLCMAGADCIRATNGGGSACTTLTTTGVGIPTATSLLECHLGVKQAEKETGDKKTLIADGGLKNSGDMAKALAIGADAVMVGGLLSGSSCCPETAFFTENGEFRAKYMGMASEEAQIARFGKRQSHIAPEGKSLSIPPKGKTANIVLELAAGLKSAFSFVNAKNLKEFQANSEFILRK